MSALGLFLVAFGLLMIVTRAPLIIAPERARALAIHLIGEPRRMRTMGIFAALLGIAAAWAGAAATGLIGQIVLYLGLITLTLAAVLMIPFPGPMATMARFAWERLSTSALRILGSVATLVGIIIAAYGASL